MIVTSVPNAGRHSLAHMIESAIGKLTIIRTLLFTSAESVEGNLGGPIHWRGISSMVLVINDEKRHRVSSHLLPMMRHSSLTYSIPCRCFPLSLAISWAAHFLWYCNCNTSLSRQRIVSSSALFLLYSVHLTLGQEITLAACIIILLYFQSKYKVPYINIFFYLTLLCIMLS
jgi:hypothetical protein